MALKEDALAFFPVDGRLQFHQWDGIECREHGSFVLPHVSHTYGGSDLQYSKDGLFMTYTRQRLASKIDASLLG